MTKGLELAQFLDQVEDFRGLNRRATNFTGKKIFGPWFAPTW
jgi:hypothetical protein